MLFSRKDLIRILWPLFFEQILAVTVGLFDTMMVSSVGEAAVSGVALVDAINLFINNIFAALATGGAVVCAQFLGAKDEPTARNAAGMLYRILFLISALLTVATLIFRPGILSLIYGRIDADVMENAGIYYLLTALSYPFLALYHSGAAVFRSMGNSKVSLNVSLGINAVNVVGNSLLIYLLHLGAAGAAIATLLSRVFGATVLLLLARSRKNPIYIERLLTFRPDMQLTRSIFHIGVPNGLESGMFQFGKLLTQGVVSAFGTASIAANAVANTLVSFEYAVGWAVGIAIVAVVGRCVGAKEPGQAKLYTKKLMGVSCAAMFTMSLLLTLFAKPIIGVFHLSDKAADLALTVILLHNAFAATLWSFSFTLPNSFRAASDVRTPMVISTVSMWVFRVGGAYLFAFGFGLGVLGVWIAMMCDWVFRAALYIFRYKSGKWLNAYKTPAPQKTGRGK